MQKKKMNFIESLNYPSKNLRNLGKEPISVPKDPLITNFKSFAGEKVNPKNFYYALFFTAFDVRDYGKEIDKFIKIFEPLNLKKIYLETYRDGFFVDEDLIKNAKKFLLKKGFKVSGAITTTHLSDKNQYNEYPSPTSCYTDRNTLNNLKSIFEKTAAIFNEIIIDDWYFTVCECLECKKQKGKMEWSEFRSKLMYEVAKKYIIDPAKKINKNVNLILKLPQWYEKFHLYGYDLERLIPIFDEIAVGTETRDFRIQSFMPVHGALLFRYIKNLAPEKVKKAWFDIYLSDEKIFSEQAYQSILGGAKEIILFCAGILPQELERQKVEKLIENTEKFDRMSGFSKIFSIPILRKANTEGDLKLHQYFLMIGIPAYLTDNLNIKEKIVILTAQSGKKNFQEIFNKFINSGKNMVITIAVANEIKKYFNVKKLKSPIKVTSVKYNVRETEIKGNLFIKEEIINGKGLALLNNAYNYVTYFKIKESMIWVVNFPYSTDEIITPEGKRIGSDYRYLLHNPGLTGILKDIFSSFSNVSLYNKIKTFYKYEI